MSVRPGCRHGSVAVRARRLVGSTWGAQSRSSARKVRPERTARAGPTMLDVWKAPNYPAAATAASEAPRPNHVLVTGHVGSVTGPSTGSVAMGSSVLVLA